MKVTFFLGQFPVASETFVINQIVGLIKLGVEVDILALTRGHLDKPHAALEEYKLVEKTRYLLSETSRSKKWQQLILRSVATGSHLLTTRVKSALDKKCYGQHGKSLLLSSAAASISRPITTDVIIAHFGTAAVVADKLQSLNLLNGKLLTVFHGADISKKEILSVFEQDYKKLFKTGELMLPISNLWKNKLVTMGCSVDKITVNRMGIDLNDFKCRELEQAIKQPLAIVSVARFMEKKGLKDAIDAIKLLVERKVAFSYTIVGEGPLKNEITRQITDLNLDDKIDLIGFQPQQEIKNLLKAADVFLLPSVVASDGDMEGIPVALMEAMATGLITVSTFHSGIPELITDNESGFLAPERDPVALADILQNISRGGCDLKSIRKNALEKVSTEFNQKKLYQQLVDICMQEYER